MVLAIARALASAGRLWAPASAVNVSAADGLDNSKTGSHTGQVKDEPSSPPLVQVGDETVAYLLCWERHERDGSWHAWVTWIRTLPTSPHY